MCFKDKLGGNVGNGAKRNVLNQALKDSIKNYYVFLIEPKKYDPSAVNPFYNPNDPDPRKADPKNRTRATILADLTGFATPEDLEAGNAHFLTDILITDWALVEDLKDSVDGVEVARLTTKPNGMGKKPTWVWRAAEGDVMGLVEAYYDKREEELADAANQLAALMGE